MYQLHADLKGNTSELLYKTDADTEDRLVVAQGKRVVEERSGDWDEQMQAVTYSTDRAPSSYCV